MRQLTLQYSQMLGYLSGASPHVKSGAISALSVLVYEDADICISIPDLVPSLLSLLRGKAIEVIKVCILTSVSNFYFHMSLQRDNLI